MKKIFEPAVLGNLTIKNRLVRSATLEFGCAEDGKMNPTMGKVYKELAEGGVGLIITGMMGIGPNSCLSKEMTKIYDEDFPEKFKELAAIVHEGGSKIVVQLGQCGAKAREIEQGDYPFAPSDTELTGAFAREMTKEEIKAIVRDYGEAALRCKESGADGVQLHCAHGYLISQFLSPLFNKRADEYGGTIENRSRLMLEAYEEIKRKAGDDYPVLVKINHSDLKEGGICPEDVLSCCMELDRRGIDGIEISAGIGIDPASSSGQVGRKDEAFNSEFALMLAEKVNTAVISVGGYRTPETVERILNSGNIAAISLCRPLIREPNLPLIWEKGEVRRSKCVSCGKCFQSKIHGCYLDKN